MKWWQRVLLNTVIFLVLANFLNGFYVYEWQSAVLAAVILSLLNGFVKPIVTLFSLPFTLITLGLFYFVINGLMIWLTSYFVPGFVVHSFGQAILVSIILSLVNSLVTSE
ncbi:putative membrane protein [Atopostipes suicloacalis DSM 15692]|uniref:Putative membrane protein n=1 Tax=Atopostipes suicloacalis DSM 15692 TaxID=1121025 RepID=A0A1M4S641_9LACT|nr:phage holin family protein [Atopostipes suicloacalis]SHE27674.1 putative membrane protein [Atopostipes suicloacalis DSM 15692]